ALASLDTFDPASTPAAWLRVIARNVAVGVLRHRAVLRSRSLSGDGGPLPVPDARPGPADAAEEAEELARGRALLEAQKAAMTRVQRLAWRLRHLEGLEYGDISEALNVPVGTLATWFRKVRTALQRQAPER